MVAYIVLKLIVALNLMLLMCQHVNDAASGCRDADCKVASSSTMAAVKLTGAPLQPCGIHSTTSMSISALCAETLNRCNLCTELHSVLPLLKH